jgi:hypothetical protein
MECELVSVGQIVAMIHADNQMLPIFPSFRSQLITSGNVFLSKMAAAKTSVVRPPDRPLYSSRRSVRPNPSASADVGLEAATKAGVWVARVPSRGTGNAESVAEHAVLS